MYSDNCNSKTVYFSSPYCGTWENVYTENKISLSNVAADKCQVCINTSQWEEKLPRRVPASLTKSLRSELNCTQFFDFTISILLSQQDGDQCVCVSALRNETDEDLSRVGTSRLSLGANCFIIR